MVHAHVTVQDLAGVSCPVPGSPVGPRSAVPTRVGSSAAAPAIQVATKSDVQDAVFEVGETVRYWSETHSLWMEAVVQKVNLVDGRAATYDLDVKRGARPGRLRRVTEGREGDDEAEEVSPRAGAAWRHPACTGGFGEAAGCKSPGDAADAGDARAPPATMSRLPQPVPMVDDQAPLPQFEIGAQVVYWSDTYHQWMEATVVKKREGGAIYDLDVKKGAQARRMRVLPAERSASQLSPLARASQEDATPHSDNTPHPLHWRWASFALSPKASPAVRAQSPLRPQPPAEVLEAVRAQSPARIAAAPQSPTAVQHSPTAGPHSPMSSRAGALSGCSASVQAAGIRTAVGGATAAATVGVRADASAASVCPGGSQVQTASFFMGTGTERRAVASRSVVTSSSLAAPAGAPQVRVGQPSGLQASELQIGDGSFDPANPAVRSKLLAALGVGPRAVIEEMKGFRGGLNEGVWFLTDPAQPNPGSQGELVLKLVRGCRIDQSLLTEAENLQKIAREKPGVTSDPALAFPTRVVGLLGPGGAKRHDLIVMRKARGDRLAEFIARKWYSGQAQALLHVFEKVGACLGEFHTRYGNTQHGDFQPSNILYDEEGDALRFIDVGGMGVPTTQGDVAHFSHSIRLLAETYGASLANDGLRRFDQGYARSKAGR